MNMQSDTQSSQPASVPEKDPNLEHIRRKLVRLMLGSILITFVLVGFVLAAVIYKIMTPNTSVANMEPAQEQQIDLNLDGQIISYHLSGSILVLQIQNQSNGNEFILYDHVQGRVVSRLKLHSLSR